MQEEHEVDADLSEGENDQPDRNAWAPEQIGLRHNERDDGRYDRKNKPYRVRQVSRRGLTLFDSGRPVMEYVLVSVRQWKSPIR
jgi:hypothetical protein